MRPSRHWQVTSQAMMPNTRPAQWDQQVAQDGWAAWRGLMTVRAGGCSCGPLHFCVPSSLHGSSPQMAPVMAPLALAFFHTSAM